MEYNLANEAERWKAERLQGVEFAGEKQGGVEKIGERKDEGGEKIGALTTETKTNPLTVWAEQQPPVGEQAAEQVEAGEQGASSAGITGAAGAVMPNFGAMPPGVGETVDETAALSTEMSSKKMKRMAGETITKEYANKLKEAEKRDADDPFTMANNYAKEQAEALAEGFFADGYQIGDGN